MKIYHNPRCTKSRQTLALLQEQGHEPEVVEYLKTPPSQKDLKAVLKQLGMKPVEIIRKGEAVFKEKFKGQELSDAEWIKVLVEHPVLIERPIVVTKKGAAIGRPPENVLSVL